MKKFAGLIGVLFMFPLLFTACPVAECEEVIVEKHLLPDSILALLPFREGDVLTYIHSGGKSIKYSVGIDSTIEIQSDFMHGKCYEFHYQRFVVSLTPNYPVLHMHLAITNFYEHIFAIVSAQSYRASVSLSGEQNPDVSFLRSIELNGITYRNVFRARMLAPSMFIPQPPPGTIHPNWVYFNVENGILRIVMSNNETFTLVP